MSYKRKTGKIGEDLACNYLQNNGYKVLERNFLCRQGEIDIIAQDKSEKVFIEVKTRTNKKYGEPADSVTNEKQKHIIKATKYYLYKNFIKNEYIRLDIIEVYLYKNYYRINHIKQIM